MSSRNRTREGTKNVAMSLFVGLLCCISCSSGFQPLFRGVSTVKPSSVGVSFPNSLSVSGQEKAPVHRYRSLFSTDPSSDKNQVEYKSLLVVLNELGQSFKPRAQKATLLASEAETTSTKILRRLQAYCYYILFIMYRGYRGFFVLLPTLFRSVYSKLLDADLAIESDLIEKSPNGEERPVVGWKTRATVMVLASIMTAAYVLGGFCRVVSRFFKTITKTSSVEKSFDAAADEFELHETRLIKKSEDTNQTSRNAFF